MRRSGYHRVVRAAGRLVEFRAELERTQSGQGEAQLKYNTGTEGHIQEPALCEGRLQRSLPQQDRVH